MFLGGFRTPVGVSLPLDCPIHVLPSRRRGRRCRREDLTRRKSNGRQDGARVTLHIGGYRCFVVIVQRLARTTTMGPSASLATRCMERNPPGYQSGRGDLTPWSRACQRPPAYEGQSVTALSNVFSLSDWVHLRGTLSRDWLLRSLQWYGLSFSPSSGWASNGEHHVSWFWLF